MKKFVFVLLLLCVAAWAQQPQANDMASTEPVFRINAKLTNGVAPGYWPTAGSGLTLNLSAGTAFCSGAIDNYAGGTLTMTASATNQVYLNTAASCAPAVKTSGWSVSDIPIASVVAGSSSITSITDVRTMFNPGSGSGGGLGDPGSNGIIKRTALNTTAAATSGDVLGLWTGTCNGTTYMRADGSCNTPGTVNSGTAKQLAIYLSNGAAVSGQDKPLYDARDYGCAFDGLTDDTACWQNVFAALSGTGWNGSSWGNPTKSGKILCGQKPSVISSQLVYNGGNNYGLNLEGSANDAGGSLGCSIIWKGAAGGVPLLFNGTVDMVLKNFSVNGAQTGSNVLYDIQIDSHNTTQSGSPSSHDIVLEHVTLYLGTYANSAAVAFGHSGCVSDQISEVVIHDPYFVGSSTSGTSGILAFCGNNLKNYSIDGGNITNFGYGVNVPGLAGFDIYHTFFGSNTQADVNTSGGSPTYLNLVGVRSEGSARLVLGSDSTPSSTNILAGYWAGTAPSDDKVVSQAGMTTIKGWTCSNSRTGSSFCKIVAASPLRSSTTGADGIFSSGSFYTNAGNTLTAWPFYDASGNVLYSWIPGTANDAYYGYYGYGISFSSTGDYGGTAGAEVALAPQWSLGGTLLFGNMKAVANSSTDFAAQSGTIQLKRGDSIKFRNQGNGGDLNGLSHNSDDTMQVGDAAGIKTGGPVNIPTGANYQINGTQIALANLSDGANVPKLYDHSGNGQASPHSVQDSCVLGTSCSVTLSGSAVFTSSTSYTCACVDASAINACRVNQTSGSAFAITGNGTDTIRYICIGN